MIKFKFPLQPHQKHYIAERRPWLFTAYSDGRWLYYQVSTTSLYAYWEDVHFELGSERVVNMTDVTKPTSTMKFVLNWNYEHHMLSIFYFLGLQRTIRPLFSSHGILTESRLLRPAMQLCLPKCYTENVQIVVVYWYMESLWMLMIAMKNMYSLNESGHYLPPAFVTIYRLIHCSLTDRSRLEFARSLWSESPNKLFEQRILAVRKFPTVLLFAILETIMTSKIKQMTMSGISAWQPSVGF